MNVGGGQYCKSKSVVSPFLLTRDSSLAVVV
jgi:hypothetical protein